jgi:ATP-binding cassette subfamily B protein
VCVLQFLQTIATLILPTLNAKIIDNGIATGDNAYIVRVGGLMLAITVVQICFAIGAVYYGSRASMGFGRDVRSDLFHGVTGFSSREVNQLGAPSLITRITNDVQQVQMMVFMTCTLLIAAPMTAIGGTVLAIREDAGLSTLLLFAIPALLVIVGSVISRMIPTYRVMQDRIDSVNRVLREQITGVRVVRAFVREPKETERFEGSNEQLTGTSLTAGRLMALMMPSVMLVMNVSTVAVIWFGANRIADGTLSLGAMIAFLTYLTQILMAVMMATWMAALIPRASVCAERIQEVFDTETSVKISSTPITEVHSRGTVEMRNVSFAYPGAEEPVVRDVSFTSLPGQTTAIVGSTGSGKTTLVNLVPRLFDVTDGVVLVDGVDVRDLQPEVLWTRVGLVPQKPYLFTGTVASNLQYGKPDATEEQMWEALEVAQARDFVAAMPGGLEASISQGGTNVSGGQRQRLAIARALVRKPEIYLFDDSFSALDLATDARLRAALAPRLADSTVIVVAQRVSTILSADQILVLDNGEQVGLGAHAELLETCPTYAEIVASQLSTQDAA